MVQWLGLHVPNAAGLGLILGQGTRSHMLQLRVHMPQLKILHATSSESESEVAQSCPTLSDPMDCSLPGSSVHGIFQAGVLEWGAIAFSVPHLRPK